MMSGTAITLVLLTHHSPHFSLPLPTTSPPQPEPTDHSFAPRSIAAPLPYMESSPSPSTPSTALASQWTYVSPASPLGMNSYLAPASSGTQPAPLAKVPIPRP